MNPTHCPNCAADLMGGRFCRACGASAAPPPGHCPTCASTQPAGSRFCADCGTQFGISDGMGWPSASAATHPSPGGPRARRTRRLWLITGLVVAGVLVAGSAGLTTFLLAGGDDAPGDGGNKPDGGPAANSGADTIEQAPPAQASPEGFREQANEICVEGERAVEGLGEPSSPEQAGEVLDGADETLQGARERLEGLELPGGEEGEQAERYVELFGEQTEQASGAFEGLRGAIESEDPQELQQAVGQLQQLEEIDQLARELQLDQCQ